MFVGAMETPTLELFPLCCARNRNLVIIGLADGQRGVERKSVGVPGPVPPLRQPRAPQARLAYV